MTGPPIVARFIGGPFDGDEHVLPHADDEWRVVLPPPENEQSIEQLAGRQLRELPREVYKRGTVVVGVDAEGRHVWLYDYVGRESEGRPT